MLANSFCRDLDPRDWTNKGNEILRKVYANMRKVVGVILLAVLLYSLRAPERAAGPQAGLLAPRSITPLRREAFGLPGGSILNSDNIRYGSHLLAAANGTPRPRPHL
jgi:hypothetical protein